MQQKITIFCDSVTLASFLSFIDSIILKICAKEKKIVNEKLFYERKVLVILLLHTASDLVLQDITTGPMRRQTNFI